MREWYDRLRALAPRTNLDSARGLAFGDALDEAYSQNGQPDWTRLAQTYGITHVVRRMDRGEPPLSSLLYESTPWAVYSVAPSAASREGGNTSSRPRLEN